MNNSCNLYHGDCLEVMDMLIEQGVKVDAIISDPPFNIARENNFHTIGRKGIDFGEWDKGFDLFSWIDKAGSLVNKDGCLIFFNDWKNIGEMAKYAEQKGFEIKDCIRWEKSNPMPRNRDRRYVVDFEMAAWLVKSNSKWVFNRKDENYERPKFVHPVVAGKEKTEHTTQKPIALMEKIINVHTNKNQTILDPFMGSGTTGVAAKQLNRNFIGIEKDENYFKIAKNRIQSTLL